MNSSKRLRPLAGFALVILACATLNAAARRALADPQLRDALLKSGAEPAATSPEELGAFVTSELPRWGKAVEQSGAKVE